MVRLSRKRMISRRKRVRGGDGFFSSMNPFATKKPEEPKPEEPKPEEPKPEVLNQINEGNKDNTVEGTVTVSEQPKPEQTKTEEPRKKYFGLFGGRKGSRRRKTTRKSKRSRKSRR
jgi:hypothetical protein